MGKNHNMFRKLLHVLVSLLAPPRCIVCGDAMLDRPPYVLCPACEKKFELLTHPAESIGGVAAAAAVTYAGPARPLVKHFKYKNVRSVGPVLIRMMHARMQTAFPCLPDVIVPLVLHRRRSRVRGFDQTILLGQGLAGLCDVPCKPGLLKRVRHTAPQVQLRAKARRANMHGAFAACPGMRGARVLLIDDVMTTGATVAAGAAACRAAGAREVWALAFARTRPPRSP